VRLVMIGSIYTDTFNTTLSIVPNALGEISMPAVDTGTLTSVAAVVGSWWNQTTATKRPRIMQDAKLTSIKLNRISATGHYVDPVTREHTYGSPIAGAESFTTAPQLSVVASLRTAVPRGRGSAGRMYLPPTAATTLIYGPDGRFSAAIATEQAAAVVDLITKLNTVYTLIGRVGVASSAGAGRFEHVTRVEVGRVADTMRSRRSTGVEDHQSVPV